MNRILLTMLVLLSISCVGAFSIDVSTNGSMQVGDPVTIQLTPNINNVSVLGAQLQANITNPQGFSSPVSVNTQENAMRTITYTPQQPGNHTVRAVAIAGDRIASARTVLPIESSENQTDVAYGVLFYSLSQNRTIQAEDVAVYDATGMIPVVEGQYTTADRHVQLYARPYPIFAEAKTQSYTAISAGSQISFTHILGTDELLVLNQDLVVVENRSLDIVSPQIWNADLPAGKYFLLLDGKRRYVTPIQIVSQEARLMTPQPQTFTVGQQISRTIDILGAKQPFTLNIHLTSQARIFVDGVLLEDSDGDGRADMRVDNGNYTFDVLLSTNNSQTLQWFFESEQVTRTAEDYVRSQRNPRTEIASVVGGVELYTSTGIPVKAVKRNTASSGGLFSIASNELTLDFPNGPVNSLSIADGSEQGMRLGIEPINIDHAQKFVNTTVQDAYAINPEFSSDYTITKQAKGTRLLKCTDYNFSTQTCFGDFEVVSQITPGQNYSFTFTPTDPLFIEDGWWNNSFERCKDIDVANIGSTDLNNYPVPVRLSAEPEMQSDYGDLRFVNQACGEGGALIAHDIEFSNSTDITAWVELPTLGSAGSTIAVYYNNSAATSVENETGVWDNLYGLVYHMGPDGNDSSPNNRDVPAVSGTGTDNSVLGLGRSFDGVADRYDMTDLAYWENQFNTRTHEVVFTTSDDITTRQGIFAEGGTVNGIMLFIDGGILSARWWSESNGWNGANLNFTGLQANTTYHAAMQFEFPGNYEFYVNGSLVGSGAAPTGISSHTGNGGIGYVNADKDYLPNQAFGPGYFEGSIHMLRTYDLPPGADWINVSYDLILGSGVSVGSEQTSAPTIDALTVTPSTLFNNESVSLNATITDATGDEDVTNANATIRTPSGIEYIINLTQSVQTGLSNSSGDIESSTRVIQAINGTDFIGEAGSINLSNFASKLITLQNNYANTPIIIATPATDNAGDNGLAPVINSINNTHINISLCEDDGATTCESVSAQETLHYYVFDVDKISEHDWIDAGTTTGVPDETQVSVSFNSTFSNTPYVFTTVQSDNDAPGNIAPVITVDSVSTSGATLAPCAHPGTGDACTATISETLGWVAIDPVAVGITDYQSGLESIANSQFTAVSFSPSITNPIMMVTKNTENGAQDGEYPQARDVTTSGADIRYCEQDGSQDCDTHNAEDMVWAANPQGGVEVTVLPDIENASSWILYNNVDDTITSDITNISVSLRVSAYDNSASVDNTNNNPDLQLQLATSDQSGYITIGNFSVSATGTYTLSTTNTTILDAWDSRTRARDVRVRAINLDYNTTTTNRDAISFDQVIVDIDYELADPYWVANFSNVTEIGTYMLRNVNASDIDNNSVNRTFMSTFEVLNRLPILQNITLTSTFGINTSDENLTATITNVSDADGHSVYNITQWYVNSQPFEVLNFQFEAPANQSNIRDYANTANATGINIAINDSSYDTSSSLQLNGTGYANVSTDLSTYLGGSASMSVWIQTTQVGDNTQWQAPGITGVEASGNSNDIFWGWIDASGNIGIQAGEGATAQSTTPINDGVWHHIVMTRNASDGNVSIYVDGVFADSVISEAGIKTTSFSSIGRIEDTGGSPEFFDGNIDNVRIYNRTLSSQQALALYSGHEFIHFDQTRVNDTWQVCITPNDGYAEANTTCSSVMTILQGSEVDVFDEQEDASVRTFAGQDAVHYANWTIASSPISNGTCQITYYDGAVENMTYNSGRSLWSATRTYDLEGVARYSVFCSANLIAPAAGTDNITIQSVVDLQASYRVTSSGMQLQVTNNQNYTEHNISLFTIVPFATSVNASEVFTTNSSELGETLVFDIDALSASETRIIDINSSVVLAEHMPLLGVSSSSVSSVVFG